MPTKPKITAAETTILARIERTDRQIDRNRDALATLAGLTDRADWHQWAAAWKAHPVYQRADTALWRLRGRLQLLRDNPRFRRAGGR